jgi:hypothetical protein
MARSLRYPTSIRLSTSQKRRLKAAAEKRGHNTATLIVWILDQWLARQDRKEERHGTPVTEPVVGGTTT